VRSGAHVDPLTRHSPALRSTGRIIKHFKVFHVHSYKVKHSLLDNYMKTHCFSLKIFLNLVCTEDQSSFPRLALYIH